MHIFFDCGIESAAHAKLKRQCKMLHFIVILKMKARLTEKTSVTEDIRKLLHLSAIIVFFLNITLRILNNPTSLPEILPSRVF